MKGGRATKSQRRRFNPRVFRGRGAGVTLKEPLDLVSTRATATDAAAIKKDTAMKALCIAL